MWLRRAQGAARIVRGTLSNQGRCAACLPECAMWLRPARGTARIVRRTLSNQGRCAARLPECAMWLRRARATARIVRRTSSCQTLRSAGRRPAFATWRNTVRATARIVPSMSFSSWATPVALLVHRIGGRASTLEHVADLSLATRLARLAAPFCARMAPAWVAVSPTGTAIPDSIALVVLANRRRATGCGCGTRPSRGVPRLSAARPIRNRLRKSRDQTAGRCGKVVL